MIEIKGLTKEYGKSVLKEVSYKFERNKIYVIKGISGCGKTTLLNILGGLETDYEGEYLYNGKNVKELNNRAREKYMGQAGYIFQSSLLLANLTVMDNLCYICNDKKRIMYYAEKLNVKHLLEKYPEQLSGGERQRISVIRTLLTNPTIVLADEPTASLDKMNSVEIAHLFEKLRSEERIIIIATHENCFDEIADEILRLDYGVIGDVIFNQHEKQIDNNEKEYLDTNANQNVKQRNSLKVLLPLIFRRNREKFRIREIMPMAIVILALFLTFAIQHNIKDVCLDYYENKYPINVFSVMEPYYTELIDGRVEGVQRFDLYTMVDGEYTCYYLLEENDSVLCYDNMLNCGTFPREDNEVIVSYHQAQDLVAGGDVEECIGQTLVIKDIEYTIAAVLNDLTDDVYSEQRDVYYSDCYYNCNETMIDVYIPYETIKQYGNKIGNFYACMVKIDNLYSEDNREFRENLAYQMLGSTMISIWDQRITSVQQKAEKASDMLFYVFAAVAFISVVFIKKDIEIDIFYRKREFGYLQIFGLRKMTIAIQLILERMAKNTLSLCVGLVLFYTVIVGADKCMGVSGFIPFSYIGLVFFIAIGFSLVSVIMPIRKLLNRKVIELIR